MEYITISKYMQTDLGDVKAYIFIAKVKDILPIYYVAVRGRDDVEGAVQRVLNRRRINSIKDFVLDGNMFFNTFILYTHHHIINKYNIFFNLVDILMFHVKH